MCSHDSEVEMVEVKTVLDGFEGIRRSGKVLSTCEENMKFVALILLSSVACSVISLGLLLNAFIVTQVFIWWLKLQALQTIDIIMASLGVVRIILLIMCIEKVAVASVTHTIIILKNSEYYEVALIFVEFCSLWWGTVLCVFYCVKITNYSNRLFMRFKMNISRMVPWLLLTSLLVSFLSSLPIVWCMYPVHHMNSTQDSNSSSTGDEIVEINYGNILIISLTGSMVPFLIFCAANCLLIVSLLKHTRNMSRKNSGFTHVQLDAHLSAIRNMVSFLFFYVLYVISSHVMLLSFQAEDLFYFFICSICVSAYPSLHSVVLVSGNSQLINSMQLLWCMYLSQPVARRLVGAGRLCAWHTHVARCQAVVSGKCGIPAPKQQPGHKPQSTNSEEGLKKT
ncbi:taste receptor type 2 member 4-like [Pseudophryne corroboree]|uniref:taste receptor type 2 member 4-like n=1 Tax=Pseudophryne corroboree TaxID=495146 RepID=UPI0030816396